MHVPPTYSSLKSALTDVPSREHCVPEILPTYSMWLKLNIGVRAGALALRQVSVRLLSAVLHYTCSSKEKAAAIEEIKYNGK